MKFLLRRLGFTLITAWAAISINFFLPRLMPGDPVQLMVARLQQQGAVSPNAMQAMQVAFGLDDHTSLIVQYFQYWGQLFRGDLGRSITFYPSSVSEVIGQALPWTLVLVGVSTVISFLLGTVLGAFIGWRRGSWAETILPLSTFLSSVPYFWMGLIVISLFGAKLGWFPLSGGFDQGIDPSWSSDFVSNALYHAVLPAITIVLSSVASWILGMRNMMVTVMDEDYVLVAQAKGLSRLRVLSAYAARNAVLPSIAGFALSISFVVSGSLLVEIVFSYPGIGYSLYQAVNNEDFPLMQGIFLIITFAVLLANLVADVAYVLLDPRTRQDA
ncbi:ABC transporter permease [Nakamurella endophytica]|uniref:Peptide ABC transporter permease n=1 Tax=Nakamurella endophytica TaxID=1748367 RepID=A0A917SRW2_9ACTN|nr:ABC transporter permease [Nakamurella endophytica]GGL94462.1 peptide ABC transporter permease [Nakamurella endophytica]